ncbi:MFS transporter [Adlercreutzia sp. ZJ473]|uniref:MFS transporter n=1 Tax=Adlercreutzia sp. ZJ473 TaxID=2722822 RepID=UPI001557013F|nr:MFS transporter [Adlercreutzia sp. ZJ473]
MAEKKFYGWKVVVVTAVLYALLGNFGLAAAQITIPVMALDPTVGMDRTMIGIGFTVFILMQGLPGPLIGKFVEKYGAKNAFLASSVLIIATGILLGLFAGASTAAYIVLFGVLLSFSSTLGGQVATQTTIGSWFVMKRGLAMAVTMGLGGVVAFSFPLITNAAIGEAGNWPMGFFLISVMGAVSLVVAFLLMRNKPADMGQNPDGMTDAQLQEATAAAGDAPADAGAAAKKGGVFKNAQSMTQGQAFRTPAFWLILTAALSIFVALNMAVSSGVLHFSGLGIDATVIAGAVAVQGIAAVAVNLVIAPLADRIEPARILGVCAGLTAAGALCAAFAQPGDVVMLYLYYILLGLGFGGNTSVMPTAFANYFGIANFPKIIGTVLLLLSLLSGLVPTIAGIAFDATGTYVTMFAVIAAICAVGALAGFLVRFPKRV